MSTPTVSIRISADTHRKVVQFASACRPRSTIQYVIEDAISDYLKVAESRLEPADFGVQLAADPRAEYGAKPKKKS